MAEDDLSKNTGLKALGENKFAKLAPMSETLHFLTNIVLSDLSSTAKILCVGAGAGPELISMAKLNPLWSFTVVEPLESLMNICKERAEEAGISSRCHFHLGYLDSLYDEQTYDAATALLVSQFLINTEDRIKFFSDIFKRLNSGGYLVSADLSSAKVDNYDNLFKNWTNTLKYAGFSNDEIKEILSAWGKNVAVISADEIESIIVSSGFSKPVLFYQALFIHGWYSRKN